MPGNLGLGQVYSYPQRLWRKRRYQYLQYFMLPKHLRYEPETEFNTGLVGSGVETVGNNNEDSNGSNANSQEKVRIVPWGWKVKVTFIIQAWYKVCVGYKGSLVS